MVSLTLTPPAPWQAAHTVATFALPASMSAACASGESIRTTDNPSSFFMALLPFETGHANRGATGRGREAKGLLQELLHLLDAGVDALLVHAGRARQADAADRVAADLDRHAAVDRDHARQRGLLAPHRTGLHLLQEGLGGHPERARGVGLAARVLHRVRAGVVGADRDHGVAAAIDDDHRDRVAARLAGVERARGHGERHGIAEVAPRDELGRRWQRKRERGAENQRTGKEKCHDYRLPRLTPPWWNDATWADANRGEAKLRTGPMNLRLRTT